MYNPKPDKEYYEKHKHEYPVSNDPRFPFPEDLDRLEISLIWGWRAHQMTDEEICQALKEI